MNLYLVEEGKAELLVTDRSVIKTIPDDIDGINAVLAYAADEEAALALAVRYEAGQIQPDNVGLYYGETVAALR